MSVLGQPIVAKNAARDSEATIVEISRESSREENGTFPKKEKTSNFCRCAKRSVALWQGDSLSLCVTGKGRNPMLRGTWRALAASMGATTEKGFMGPVAKRILAKVSQAFECETLVLENQSHLHAGHTGNPDGAPDAETHFKLRVVSVRTGRFTFSLTRARG